MELTDLLEKKKKNVIRRLVAATRGLSISLIIEADCSEADANLHFNGLAHQRQESGLFIMHGEA